VTAIFGFVAGGVLVVRNWLNGRGDRQGAFRAAVVVFCLRFAVWIIGGHHVPDAALEASLLVAVLGKSLTDAAVTWCAYVALEPHVRRLYPRVLVSWTRLLRGRLTDPLVGRDVLYSVALSTLVVLFWAQLYVVVPHALGWADPPAPMPHPIGNPLYMFALDTPPPMPLAGGRQVVSALLGNVLTAFGLMIMSLPFLLGLRLLLRRTWAAAAVALVCMTFAGWPVAFGGLTPVAIACSLAGVIAIATLGGVLRYGFTGFAVMVTCMGLWVRFPITANVNAPYFGTGLLAVLFIAALAAFGAFTASRRARFPAAI
jgi:hypothetical protein